MAADGQSGDVKLGPGRLWVAPVGTTEPVSASTAIPSAFRSVGYTEEGNVFATEITTEAVEVAEELDPLRYVNTRRAASVQFSMAEMTRENLALALNAGANAANTAQYFEPPDLGTEVRCMIVWDSNEDATDLVTNGGNVRWIYRQCYQVDAIETARTKAPQKSLIPVRFQLEKPTGLAPYKVFPNASGQVA
jgi:hypothetical protein